MCPLLFKIFLERALNDWKKKCGGMRIPIDDEVLYTLLFADNQLLLATDRDDISYMLRKLKEEYNKWGLTINTLKTEYITAGYENDKATCILKMK